MKIMKGFAEFRTDLFIKMRNSRIKEIRKVIKIKLDINVKTIL